MTRCKFKCESITVTEYGTSVKLTPVINGSKENEEFFRYTPWGQFEIGSLNPEVAKQFKPGKEYYIDITEA